ncbi:MAG TPA: DUF4175 family protein, partial [Rhodospirillales bacterium]|nr:DUF4175 family protein [Rhodospirillales bacterium]
LAVLPDLAPVVGFSRPPQADKRKRLALAYEASDDYAVEKLSLEIRLQDGSLLAADRVTRLEIPLAAAPSARQHLTGEIARNLVAHPWAGLAVELTLRALDGAGQEGLSEPEKMILPEREFTHPVARAIITQRRRLALLKPGSARKIARDVIVGLELIKQKPTAFESSTTVFLALGVAQARLRHGQDRGKYEAVMNLLWNVAISLEDGELAVAERELETAREELNDALANNADGDEIDRLMDRVAEALDNYLQALAEQLQADGGVEMDLDPLMRMLGADDLRQLLDQARQMARTGATEAARQMLSQLDRLLEGVQGAMRGGSAMADMNQVLQQFSDMLERVRRLTQRQQDLLDDTFKDSQNGAGKSPVGAAAQKALREQLGDLMLDADEVLGAIPPALGRADRDMNDAAQSLARGKLTEAVGQQSSAVENLRQGIDQMSSQMAQMMAGTLGFSFGQNGMGMGQMPGERDPFGRLTGNGGLLPGGKIGIPERGQVQRSRQILDELRRRAGQRQRPRPERDYIDRLLKKF